MDVETDAQEMAQRLGKVFEAGFDASVIGRPGAPGRRKLRDGQGAAIDHAIRFDLDAALRVGSGDTNVRVATPNAGRSAEVIETGAQMPSKLWRHVQQGRQGKRAILELGVRHT